MDWRAKLTALPVTRRQLVAGAAVGGGLGVAWWLWPRHYTSPLSPGPNERDFGGWITIGRDGVVTVAVPQLEMGQGVTTVLAQVVAVELGADWRQVAVEPSPPAGLYANIPLAAKWAPLWSNLPGLAGDPDSQLAENYARSNAFAATADGTSLAAYELPLREAAATARAVLAMAAAERWDVDWEECLVERGIVRHAEQQLGFGALVAEAAELDPPDPPPLRVAPASEDPAPAEAELAPDFPRLDLPAKVDGSFLFASDIRLPGMVFASIRHGPLGKPDLSGFEAVAVEGLDGLVGVVKSRRYLAAVAESWWVAEQALKAMRPVFAGPPAVESAAALEALDEAHGTVEPRRTLALGDADELLARPDYAQTYAVGPAVHAAIETASATARYDGGNPGLWIAAQAPELTRRAAAHATRLPPHPAVSALPALGRVALAEPLRVELGAAGAQRLGTLLGLGRGGSETLGIAAAAALGFMALAGREFRNNRRLLFGSILIGCLIVAGWWTNGIVGFDEFETRAVGSFSFARPVGDTLLYAMLASGTKVDFGVGSVLGVLLGAFLAARGTGEFHWEAPDDAREVKRHLLGAFLMGTGGVTALGCTIGQGLSGLSTLSAGSMLALASILVGARAGLYYLVDRHT